VTIAYLSIPVGREMPEPLAAELHFVVRLPVVKVHKGSHCENECLCAVHQMIVPKEEVVPGEYAVLSLRISAASRAEVPTHLISRLRPLTIAPGHGRRRGE
jgi:hypothetical protein